MSKVALLMAAGLLLVGCCVASLMLLRVDERLRRVRGRRMGAVAPYRRAEAGAQAGAGLAYVKPAESAGRGLRRLLGMDPDRPEPYAFPPVLVLPACIVPGLVVRWLIHGLFGPASWIVVPACWLLTVRGFYQGSDAKRTATLLKQFPDALNTISRAVRVGLPVTEAMRAVARDAEEPTASEFARVHDKVTIGTPLEDALRDLAARARLPEYRFFATALSLQSQTGGGLTETLENLADVIRKRVALKARGFALASEARTSAGVLAVLPVFAGGALSVLNPSYIAPLFKEGPGQTLFGCGALWLGLGLLSMRALIKKSLS